MKTQIIKNLDINAYHYAEPYSNHHGSTGIKAATKSLKHYKHYIDNPPQQERKSHFDFGNAFELALIDDSELLKRVAIMDESQRPLPDKDYRTKANKDWKTDFLAQHAGKYVINLSGDESLETINEMIVSCQSDPTISKLLKMVTYQDSFFWTCPKSGLPLKSRPDLVIEIKNTIIDIKTTRSLEPRSINRDINDYGYPIQAIQQIEGYEQLIGRPVENYFWLFVEKNPPFDAVLFAFSAEDRQNVRTKYELTKMAIKSAEASGDYPGYRATAQDNEFGILTAKIY